jgi:hypothetical protein
VTPGADFNIGERDEVRRFWMTVLDGSLETNGFYIFYRFRRLHFLFRATSHDSRKRKDEAYLKSDTTINPHSYTSFSG